MSRWCNQNPTRNSSRNSSKFHPTSPGSSPGSSPSRSFQCARPLWRASRAPWCYPGAARAMPGCTSECGVAQVIDDFDLVFYGFSMIFLCFVWDAWGCYNTELNELRSTSVCFAFVQPFRVRHYGNLWKLLRMFNACSTHLPSFHLFSFPCMPWQSMAAPTAWPECCTHAACGMHDSLPVFSQVI